METENKFLPKKDTSPTCAWEEYYKNTENYPPRGPLVRSLAYIDSRDNALDLGSGALNDSRYLIEQGFNMVTAVDMIPVAIERANKLPSANFQYKISSFEEFMFPEDTYDLVSAQLSLPFIAPGEFDRVFTNISNSLKKGGVFTGQFYGNKHGWSSEPKMTFHTKEDAVKLLSDFEELSFSEIDESNELASGKEIHWHLFNFIVRKI